MVERSLAQHLLMSLQVESQVVRPGERPLTELTRVGPDPGVFPHVSSKFVRSGELPATAGPGADVGLLSGVRPQVGLHVAGLVVNLPTVFVRTVVNYRGFLDGPPPPLGHGGGVAARAGGRPIQTSSCGGGTEVQPHLLSGEAAGWV